MQKVIEKWCTFVLFSRVFANQNPRRSTSLAFVASCPLHFRHHDEKSHTATPLVPADYKCPLPQPLSLHILTNAPGVWGSTRPFLKFYLNSFCSQRTFPCKKSFCKPFVFCALRTLPSSVSCNSFLWHSYENCRVYTNSSHFGTLSTEPLQGTTPVRAAFARSASLRYPFPLFASQLSTLNYQSKIPSGSGLSTFNFRSVVGRAFASLLPCFITSSFRGLSS